MRSLLSAQCPGTPGTKFRRKRLYRLSEDLAARTGKPSSSPPPAHGRPHPALLAYGSRPGPTDLRLAVRGDSATARNLGPGPDPLPDRRGGLATWRAPGRSREASRARAGRAEARVKNVPWTRPPRVRSAPDRQDHVLWTIPVLRDAARRKGLPGLSRLSARPANGAPWTGLSRVERARRTGSTCCRRVRGVDRRVDTAVAAAHALSPQADMVVVDHLPVEAVLRPAAVGGLVAVR